MQTVEEVLGTKPEEQLSVESILGSPQISPTLKDKPYQPEPPSFKIDEFVNDWQKTRSMDEDPPQDDLANIFDRISTPFGKLWYSAAGSLNRQLGSLFTNFDTIFEYAEQKRIKVGGKPIPPEERLHLLKKMGDQFEENSNYWQALVSKSPPDFINEFIGKFVGSLGPGMLEFGISLASLLTYPAILGAAEAKKEGASALGETVGAITKAAEVALLGLIFHAVGPFSIYAKAPILGTIFGLEDTAKQLGTTGKVNPDQLIESTATGFGLGLIPGGRMGLKDIAKNMKGEIGRVEAKLEAKRLAEAKPEIKEEVKPVEPKPEAKVEGVKEQWKSVSWDELTAPQKKFAEDKYVKETKDEARFAKESDWWLNTQTGELSGKPGGLETLRKEVRAEEQAGKVTIGQPPKPPTFEFTDPVIEKSYQESVPIKEPFIARVGEYFTDMWHKMTRPYEYIPRNKEFAQLQFDLTKLQKQKGVASYDSVMEISKTLSGLKAEDYDIFTRKVILDDLSREAEKGHDLPWGFDKDTIKVERDRVNAIIDRSPIIQDALIKRKTMWDTVKDEYIKAMDDIGFDVSDRLKNEDYFRHQVLEYTNLQGLFGTGKKLKTPSSRGFLKARKGTELNINRDFIQPEYEVMSQMLYDIQVARTIKDIDKNYSITKQVQKDAKIKGLEDWHDAIPKGYVTWQPREGNVFYMVDSIPAKLAEKLHTGALKELGITEADLRQSLAIGGRRKEFVVKEEVAKTLDELVKTKGQGVLGDADRALMRGIKAWFLFAPRRYLKYEARNMTGDADASFVGNPRGFLKTPQATKELGDVLFGKKEITGELKEFFDRGGFDSTLFAQEMGDLQSLWTFERLYKEQTPGITEIPYRVWKKYWKTVRVTNTFRETILRYGNYLDYLKQMEKNPEGRPNNFGGSKPDEIMGLKDNRDRAYWLSNDLIGPYDRISVMGQNIREYWYPFWSWKELNLKRYVQFAKNAASDGRLAETAGKKMLGTVAKTPYMAYKVGKFLISATAFWTALQVWNHTMFPEEEDDLAEDVKSNPHIIFGRDSEGNIIYFNRIGALGDFLEWFGLDDSPKYVDKWMKGEMTLKEIAEDMVKSPVNVIVQGLTPQIKVPAELITGRTLFPDVFKPGTIRDRGLYLSRSLGLDNEYKAIAGLPSKGYQESLKNFFVYTADPGQGAYADIQETKRRWLKEQGKGAEGFWLTPKGNALYNLKLAIRYKDEEATNKYMYEYFTLGGTAKGIEESLDRMNPLSGLSKRDRSLFEQSLSSGQIKRLEKAMEFYYGTLKGGTK